MVSNFTRCFFVLFSVVFLVSTSLSQVLRNEQQILVTMRTIGHQVLKESGNDVSRVLPIQQENGRYKIEFDTEFQFQPEKLSATIDRELRKVQLEKAYVVEVEACKTAAIVYNYEVNTKIKHTEIPCLTRIPPKACYTIFISLLGLEQLSSIQTETTTQTESTSIETQESGFPSFLIAGVALLFSLFFLLFFQKKGARKKKNHSDSSQINLGRFLFDTKNGSLILADTRIELSGKERDLLLMLYSAENETLERDHILQQVWGDDGDYIGRTLDVFISKLRKKLEGDSCIKIVNVRGVGYKLLINS